MQSSSHYNYRHESSRGSSNYRRSKFYHPLHNQMCYLARNRSSQSARIINDYLKPDDSFEDAVNDVDGINFVSFMKYVRVRDTSFYARNIVRHKIHCRRAYFPEDFEDAENTDITECNRSQDSGVAHIFTLSDTDESFANLTLETDSITSQSQKSDDATLENIASRLSSSHLSMNSHNPDVDNNPDVQHSSSNSEVLSNLDGNVESATVVSYESSLEEINGDDIPSIVQGKTINPAIVGENKSKIKRNAQPDSRRMMIDVGSLPMLIRAKLMVSRGSKFVIWLKGIESDLAYVIASCPGQFVLCVESLDFLGTTEVMSVFQSIGMMFVALNMLDTTNNCFKLIWILSFAHKPFKAATSEQFFNSVDELTNVAANHFIMSKGDDSINIIRTFCKPCHRCD